MNTDFTCTRDRIILDVPHQLWEATTADGSGGVWITRMFHNKLFFYANNFLRCYLYYLSPDFLTAVWTILGTILFLIGVYFALMRKSRLVLISLLLSPILPVVQLPQSGFVQGVVLYGTQVLVISYGLLGIVSTIKFRLNHKI